MHYFRLSVHFVLAAGLASAATPSTPNSSWSNMHTKHRWNAVPEKWERVGHPSVGTMIDLRIALKPLRENALIDVLNEVSNPKHPKYGAYLSKEQVAELVAPHPDTLKLVGSWLEYHGVLPSNVSTSHGGGWLTVTGVPVSKANDLLGASYELYRYAGTNETILRTVGYALPSALYMHVQTVAPTTFFGSPGTLRQTPHVQRSRADAALLSREEPFVEPAILRRLYNTWGYRPTAMSRNKLGITGFHGQYASFEDLIQFMEKFRSDAENPTFTFVEINSDGYDPDHPGVEANIDMQYAQAIAYPTPHVFYSISGEPAPFIPDSFQPENNNEPFLDWLNYMATVEDPPQTISTSYGGHEQTFPPDYAKSVCELLASLGTRGVSLIFASGDAGVGGADCKKNDGSGVVQFQPIFPPTCPYVTSVGGTTSRPEVAAELSSGGFSNIFRRPKYQADAVPKFFQELGDTHSGLYNESSRGFPDVAAQAVDLIMIENEDGIIESGTSFSAPIVAGIIALLNDYRLSQGDKALGFLNPWLYGEGTRRGFNDITKGTNPGCDTEGFSAITGWDPVTGLGTLNFKVLLEIMVDPATAPSETDEGIDELM